MLTRLRSRGDAAAAGASTETGAENPTEPSGAAAAATRRSVLGDVSNKRQSQKDGGAGKVAKKKQAGGAKRAKNPFTAAAPSNGGLSERGSRASKQATKTAVADVEDARRSTRGARAVGGSTAARRSARTSSRAASANGSKRAGATAGEEETRRSKRAKIAGDAEEEGTSKAAGGRSRSRARAQDERPLPEKEAIVLSDDDESAQGEEVEPRNLNDEFVVPPDYRLERASFNGTNHTEGIAPHDMADKDNVLQVAPYVTDCFQHFYRAEAKSSPELYMQHQADINAKMRAILVDWLVEVHMKFRLVPETLYLCVNIIDRYCSLVPVARSRLQLVGVTALLIACKYEEIYPPEVRDCVYITDRAYTRQEVLDCEQDVLQRLRFKITVPTAYPFLQRFLHMMKVSQLTRFAANYYIERTLQEHDLLRFKPSVIAASAVILALNNPDIPDDDCPGVPKILLEYTGFGESEIMSCVALIATKVGEEPITASKRQLIAVKRKYDNRKYQHASVSVREPSADDVCAAETARNCV